MNDIYMRGKYIHSGAVRHWIAKTFEGICAGFVYECFKRYLWALRAYVS